MYTSQRALAAALGVAVSTVNGYLRDPQWQKFGLSRSGPWSAADVVRAHTFTERHYARLDVQQHSSSGRSTDPASEIRNLSPERRARLQAWLETAATKKLDRELKLGSLVKRDDVVRGNAERAKAVRAALDTLRSLAPRLVGADLQQQQQILEGWAKSVCDRFSEGVE